MFFKIILFRLVEHISSLNRTYLLLQSEQLLSALFFAGIIAIGRIFFTRATRTTASTFHGYHSTHWLIRDFRVSDHYVKVSSTEQIL